MGGDWIELCDIYKVTYTVVSIWAMYLIFYGCLSIWFFFYLSPSLSLLCIIDGIENQESERVVSREEGISLAKEFGCIYLECSARTRENVERCFEELALKVKAIH